MAEGALSAGDVLALSRDNDMFGGNWGGIIGLLIIAGIFGNGGFFGGNNNFENRFLERDVFNTNTNVLGTASATQMAVAENKYDTAVNMFGISKDILLGNQQLLANQDRCCCDIKTAVHAEGEATRNLIQENLIQGLRDKIADKDREALATGLSYSQTITTRNSEDRILGNLGNYYPKIGVNPYYAYQYPYNFGTTVQ